MATVERIQLDSAAPPERLPYDAVWVVLPDDGQKEGKPRPLRGEFLKWLDWRSLGQLTRALQRPAQVPTYVALGPEMPVRWLMVDRSKVVDADALYNACGSLGLERLLVVSGDLDKLEACTDALEGCPSAKGAGSVYVAVTGEVP